MSDQLFQLIVSQAWQIAVLAFVVAIVTRTVAKNRPHLAHAMWLLVLVKCVTPPIWGHSLGLFSRLQAAISTEQSPAASDATYENIPQAAEPTSSLVTPSLEPELYIAGNSASDLTTTRELPTAESPPATVPAIDLSEVATTKSVEGVRGHSYSWPAILLFCVAAGAFVTLSLMIVRCVQCLRSIHRHRTTEFDDLLMERVQDLSHKLRLRRAPRVIVSDVLFGPAVLGLLRHTIVLPRCLIKAESGEGKADDAALVSDRLSALRCRLSSLDPILAHELLHIRRGDLRTGTLQAIVQSLWWFHPAVWLCNRWLSREAERCCDEQVIAELGCSPAQYARSLLSVIESKHQLQPVPVFPGMKPVEITSQRMERIMSLKTGLKKQTPLWCWPAVAVLAIIVLPGAVATPTLDETESVSEVAPGDIQKVGDSADAIRLNKDFVVTPDVKPNAIVAYVNEKPVTLEDLVPSKFILNRPDHQKFVSPQALPMIIQSMLRTRLPNFLYDELAMQHFTATIPQEQQAMVCESLKPEFRNVVKNIKTSEDCESDEQLSERLAQEHLSLDVLEHNFIRMQVVSGYVQTLPADSPLRAREKFIETVSSLIDDWMPIRCDISLDENFVLSRTIPIAENAVIAYLNGRPVDVKSVLENTSTGILLKHIPEMDEYDRRRLVADAIEKLVPEYMWQEVILQHFDARLSPWEERRLADAEAERETELFKMLPDMLSKSKRLENQEQLLSKALMNHTAAQKAEESVLANLSRDARVSRLIKERQSRQLNGVQKFVQERCRVLLMEARLRIDVSLRFDDRDLTDVLRSVATEHGVNIALATSPVAGPGGEISPNQLKVTYQCENQPLGEALATMLEPLGLRFTLEHETVKIGIAKERSAADAATPSSEGYDGPPTPEWIREPIPDSSLTPFVPSPSTPSVIAAASDPLLMQVWETRESARKRLLHTDQHTPWQIMAGLQGLRRDLLLLHDGKIVNGLEWIQSGPMYQDEPWFQKTEHGGRAHPFSKPYVFEGHINQFFSKLAACRLPLDTQFGTPDGPITIQDMINHAKMVVNDKEEVSWTLLALCRYLPPDAKWTNAKGEEWSIERLVQVEVGKQVGGSTSPNGGTDGLYALAVARNEYLKTGKPLEGVWLKSDEKIRNYIDIAKSQQNPDGTLSSDFFRSSKRKDDFDKRLASSGHLLQFLMHAVSDEQLKEDWIRRAVEATANDIQVNRKEYVSCDPLFTATEALTTYLERVTKTSIGCAPQSPKSEETSVQSLNALTEHSPKVPVVSGVTSRDDRLVMIAYNVSDLTAQFKTSDAEMSFSPLVELIKTSIEPESWENGSGTIFADKKTICMVIRQTQTGHDGIAKILSQLRKSYDSVKVTCRLIKLTADSQLKGLEDKCSLHPLSNDQRWALLTKSRGEALQKFLADEKAEVLSCPTIVTISGQPALVQVASTDGAALTGFQLSANPHLIADSSVIRLSHSVTVGELAKDAQAAVHESLVGSGQTLLLVIEQPGKVDGRPDRFVVMLTPEHVKEEEETKSGLKE